LSDLSAVARAFCESEGHTFVARVGSGAFKETFHATLATGYSRALKVHQPGFSLERTTRELSAMERCEHPNIARLFAISEFAFDGSQHLVTLEEFLPGGTLSLRLKDGQLSRPEICAMALQLADGVAHIASIGLVHRDLKPDNILFREDRVTPVIVDFGLVRDLADSSLTESWFIRGPGTPFFAPPEQLRNEKAMIDWRADQFSLGVLLAVSLFGLHPYQAEGTPTQQVVERVAQRSAHPDSFLKAATQADLDLLVKMTAPWPVDRFRTPRELCEAWKAR
jgi:serine/threonine protein kinase